MKYLLTYFLLYLNVTAAKPNIILIYTDDQGYGDSSLLNPESKFKTPHIDSIGQEGIIFTDGHSSDTVCSPSRYSLLTGRYSWRTYLKKGVISSTGEPLIKNDRTTIASILKRNGYNTAMVGKWHMGMKFNEDGSKILDGPLNKGFDYYYGIPASMNYGYNAWYEMDRANVPPTLWTRKKPNKIALNDYRIIPPYDKQPLDKRDIRVAEDFTDIDVLKNFTNKALSWIDENHNNGKPFFLYFPMTSPHKPVIPAEQFRGKSLSGSYGDFMIETDFRVGEIIQRLKKHGIYENTMIIFSSDNGPEHTWEERIKKYNHCSNKNYKGGKRDIYEGGHRVPFLVSWPKGIKKGQVCNLPVNQIDILATIADVVGEKLKHFEAEDSVSFQPAFHGKNYERQPMIHHSSTGGFAIRNGDWKLVLGTGKQSKPGSMELYNLKEDPGEESNIIKTNSEKALELKKLATKIINSGRTTKGDVSENDSPLTLWWEKSTGN